MTIIRAIARRAIKSETGIDIGKGEKTYKGLTAEEWRAEGREWGREIASIGSLGKITIEVEVVANNFPAIKAELRERAAQAVAAAALEIEAQAKMNTVRVDTGTMKNGWQATQIDELTWEVDTVVEYA